ncbi:hypothetical protein JAAARDRAFT_210303 [Jaapia argillacea MUCL 33604]|uniref:DUF6534 domain-containing protein n=1 Tax=Jaapia argillacea MUCL 33604 TaxID=933084 RepID=A0A067PD38_9AGAM|nr:hypothetical protein JAAARDRAFT_210303 [Jaapia argillacea MUCL 33604]
MSIIDLTVGPNLIGTVLNVFLYGVLWMQCLMYFTTYKTDKPGIRALVWFHIIAGTVNTGFLVYGLYKYTITNFGNLMADQIQNWTAFVAPTLTAVIGAVVQTFFARRVYILTSKRWLAAVIGLTILLQFIAGICIAVLCAIHPNFADWGRWYIKFPTVSALVLGAVVDCMITASLTSTLYRSKTGFPSTDHVVTKLIRLTIQTGMIVAVFAVVDLVLYLSSPWPWHLLPGFTLNKLYAITMISTLNARNDIRQSFSGHTATAGQWQTKDPRRTAPSQNLSSIQVQVTTEASVQIHSPQEHQVYGGQAQQSDRTIAHWNDDASKSIKDGPGAGGQYAILLAKH